MAIQGIKTYAVNVGLIIGAIASFFNGDVGAAGAGFGVLVALSNIFTRAGMKTETVKTVNEVVGGVLESLPADKSVFGSAKDK